MKFDTTLLTHSLETMPSTTQAAQDLGFDGIWTSETANDAFFPLVLAAEHSHSLNLGTSIAVAFPRSPAILAYMAWDLARYSQGRFIMGLGTQVKGHNERRFSVKWEHPLGKMREVILSMRAFWDCWQNGTKLNFDGEFYKFNLMTPFFSPQPHDYAGIPIYIAAVNPLMCQLAGELCEGVHVHPFHSVKYVEELVLPNITKGLAKTGRKRGDISLSSTVFVIPTDDAEKAPEYEASVRQQISFYASTPAYRIVFETHGWEEIAAQLSALAVRGRWDEMPHLISDEILDTLAIRGTWADIPGKVIERYEGGLLDRVSYYFPFISGENDEGWKASIAGFKSN
jgi:probable F420-dependent oxidoreductase